MPAACTCSRTKPFTLPTSVSVVRAGSMIGLIVCRILGIATSGLHNTSTSGWASTSSSRVSLHSMPMRAAVSYGCARWFHALTAQPAERRRTASEPPMSPRPTMPTCCGHSMPSAAIAGNVDVTSTGAAAGGVGVCASTTAVPFSWTHRLAMPPARFLHCIVRPLVEASIHPRADVGVLGAGRRRVS